MQNPLIQDLFDFIWQSPSPWHAVHTVAARLQSHRFSPLNLSNGWSQQPEGRYFLACDGALIAWIVGQDKTRSDARIIGAHTDSPTLRLKPNTLHQSAYYQRLGVEVYGSPILATFTDRDLRLAGRVFVRDAKMGGTATHLLSSDALVRLPNLAIHLQRQVNDEGLKLQRQKELPLIFSSLLAQLPHDQQWRAWLAAQISAPAEDILSFELNVADAQKGQCWGAQQEFIASPQLDNLASCHAALTAFLQSADHATPHIRMIALFDHEEIGSTSHRGAQSDFLPQIWQRISHALGIDTAQHLRDLTNSLLLSADMAHAWHPNFAECYEPDHTLAVNAGPAAKINVNQRYATDGHGLALFKQLCQEANIPHQIYVHQNNLACGSTIGPLLASQLAIRTIDVGNPMWAMHSLRESAGAEDHGHMVKLMGRFLA